MVRTREALLAGDGEGDETMDVPNACTRRLRAVLWSVFPPWRRRRLLPPLDIDIGVMGVPRPSPSLHNQDAEAVTERREGEGEVIGSEGMPKGGVGPPFPPALSLPLPLSLPPAAM